MNQYKLTLSVTIRKDVHAARNQAKGILEAIIDIVENADVMLQKVCIDRAPRGVRMNCMSDKSFSDFKDLQKTGDHR